MTTRTRKAFSNAANLNLRVIYYADADPVLKKKMDQLMEAIDRTPEKRIAISAYGQQPALRLRAFYQCVEGLSPQYLANEKAQVTLPQIRKAIIDLNAYLGAAGEIMQRYDKKYIVNARNRAKMTEASEAANYLEQVTQRRESFIDHKLALEQARAYGLIAMHRLEANHQQKQFLESHSRKNARKSPIIKNKEERLVRKPLPDDYAPKRRVPEKKPKNPNLGSSTLP